MESAKKLTQTTDTILVKVQGNNYNKYLTINQNLLIANIKAIVEYELQ